VATVSSPTFYEKGILFNRWWLMNDIQKKLLQLKNTETKNSETEADPRATDTVSSPQQGDASHLKYEQISLIDAIRADQAAACVQSAKPSPPAPWRPGEPFSLSQEQDAAAQCLPGKTAIVATAGSGKTTTLAIKLRRLIADGVRDEDILATTFTKAAAEDLKRRVDQYVGRRTRVITGTLHSFCLTLIRTQFKLAGFSHPPIILSQSERQRVLQNLVLEHSGARSVKDAPCTMSDVDRWITEMEMRRLECPSEDRTMLASRRCEGLIRRVVDGYLEKSRVLGFVDFDQILSCAVEILRESDHLGTCIKLPRHVFVDEAQDLNSIQWLLVDELGKKTETLDVIGDDDQSIYAWRGASPHKFISFIEKADHKYVLGLNRRCGDEIISLARSVISQIPDSRRVTKALSGTGKRTGAVDMMATWNVTPFHEIAGIVSHAVRQKRESTWSDFAFICRSTTHTFPELEAAFRYHQIPYRILGGDKSVFESPEIEYLRLMCGLAGPGQENAKPFLWESLLLNLGASPQAATNIIRRMMELGGGSGSLDQAVRESRIAPQTARMIRSALADIRLARSSGGTLRSLVSCTDVSETVSKLISKSITRSLDQLEKKGRINKIERDRRAGELLSRRQSSFNIICSQLGELSLQVALDRLTAHEKGDEAAATEAVTITTCHSSKGLEFKNVFILEADDSNWPSAMSMRGDRGKTEESQDEELRLLYVAITRAIDRVVLVARKSTAKEHNAPSRFFGEGQVRRAMVDVLKKVDPESMLQRPR
jgi:DNA helicase-2/ATP-dependent DNA helicase PcrA